MCTCYRQQIPSVPNYGSLNFTFRAFDITHIKNMRTDSK